nr:hypothetical protein [Cohnella panacarvi]
MQEIDVERGQMSGGFNGSLSHNAGDMIFRRLLRNETNLCDLAITVAFEQEVFYDFDFSGGKIVLPDKTT